MIKYLYFSAFILLFSCKEQSNTLFRLVDSSHSGVTFNNKLDYEIDSLTILDFEYKYNGAGVSIGDVNNDGLPDLFFTGNMVSSKLYLNKGDLKFEDITESARVSTSNWATGSAMVDINQDGFLDIYVCMGGYRFQPDEVRTNLLFINNGDNTFTESAAAYGLDDQGYSIQSVFFDYDKDGDLDIYLLQNGLVSFNRNTPRDIIKNGKPPYTDKLYRNNGDNTYSNVSREAGIMIEGFGLGVEAGDLNDDGWPDIYVSNDFLTNDLIYINNQNGTFTESARAMLKHQTLNGMGNDVVDINNDGLQDIAVLDMLPEDNKQWKLTIMGNNYDVFKLRDHYGYQPQYMRNTLQLNNGNGTFSEIGQLSGIHATDWSWSILFADYDNNGLVDPFITNGYRQNITNLDFITYSRSNSTFGNHEDFRRERVKVLKEIEGVKRHNYIFQNNGDLTFTNRSEAWGMEKTSYSNGAAYGDLDNDGDLDLVVSNIDEEAFIYENTLIQSGADSLAHYLRITLNGPKGNIDGYGTKVYLYNSGGLQYQYFSPWRGYLSSVEPVLHFGVNENAFVDSLKVIWPNGNSEVQYKVKVNQEIELNYSDAHANQEAHILSGKLKSPVFEQEADSEGIKFYQKEDNFVDFKLQPTLPHMHSQGGPGMSVGDINGDGLDDIYIGGATGSQGSFYIQNKAGEFSTFPLQNDANFEEMGSLFFDVENDGDLDLYVVSGGSTFKKESNYYQDNLFINDGKGQFSISENSLPKITSSGASVVAADYDRDGDLDLFVCGRVTPGSYPVIPESYLLRNDSKNDEIKFTNVTEEVGEGLSGVGMLSAALWTDFDNDGWVDLIVAGEFMPVTFYKNNQGKLVNVTNSTGIQASTGWWNSIAGGDFDKDGDIDYVLGNLGLNSYYKASEKEPIELYAADFDKNGRIDPIITHYVDGKKYLIHTRQDLIEQISGMRARFKTYEEYANSLFDDTFLPEELEKALVFKAERFQSSFIENLGDGKFQIKDLPVQAQFSAVYGMEVDDFDGNGKLDILLIGNTYSPEPNMGHYDALTGVYLEYNEGGFNNISDKKTGFFSDGNARSIVQLSKNNGERLVIVGNNQGAVSKHIFNIKDGFTYQLPLNAAYAIVEFANGKKQKQEFYYGSGYVSQTTRKVHFPETAKNIELFNWKGELIENVDIVLPVQ